MCSPLVTNFLVQMSDSFSANYREASILNYYWTVWGIVCLLLLYSHFKEKPNLIRILNMIMILRNIVPLFNFEDRTSFDDMTSVVQFSHFQNVALQAIIICVCVTEKYTIHVPFSIICQLLISYGQMCLFL